MMDIQRTYCTRETHDLTPAAPLPDLRAWLLEQAEAYHLPWLLAHCEDGAIWGTWDGSRLALSCDAFPARKLSLRPETLQQCRLFGADAELLLWHGPNGQWRARLWRDADGDQQEYYDESHLLWGYQRAGETLPRNDGFVQITEGAQGIVHAPPIGDATPTETRRAALRVRHYLAEDEAGMVRIRSSRLVRLLQPGEV